VSLQPHNVGRCRQFVVWTIGPPVGHGANDPKPHQRYVKKLPETLYFWMLCELALCIETLSDPDRANQFRFQPATGRFVV
jgi:hypothetical protein